MARTTSKVVEVMGRKFKISAFDSFTGSYIAYTVFEKALPRGIEQQFAAGMGGNMPARSQTMGKQEFIELQRDCLSAVAEILPAGERPLLNSNGSWGVNDIADNTVLVVILTVHALVFNMSAFFEEGGLKALKDSLSSLMLSNIKTSIRGSMPQSSQEDGSSTSSGTAHTR